MSEVNIPLLRKAVEWAEAEAAKPNPNDRRWNQGAWHVTAEHRAHVFGVPVMECGTAYCIAGFVAQSVDERYVEAIRVDDVAVSIVATEALGIEEPWDRWAPEKGHLFHSGNTIEDVRRIAEELAGERL